ncbi:flagellar hook-basal body complex protein FliE [Imbroritus primus]|jgi:flagellar hook-basal body complex protein FliE|uniref:flagellar hook-basal body complex protein FliE n=1 Tax=Imbroritus primus TaxID=3058603 RepID=UPI003D16145E
METTALSTLSTALQAARDATGATSASPVSQAARRAMGAGDDAPVSVDFGSMLKASLDKVDALQKHGERQAVDFELGNGVELHEAMLAMQKGGIAFQTTVQVRNRLVSAYHDIMNMSV